MASDQETSSPRPAALVRLDAAVGELEEVLDWFESAHRGMAEELARTKAELTTLQTLHETVSRRLDDAIARLKVVLAAQAKMDAEAQPHDGQGGA